MHTKRQCTLHNTAKPDIPSRIPSGSTNRQDRWCARFAFMHSCGGKNKSCIYLTYGFLLKIARADSKTQRHTAQLPVIVLPSRFVLVAVVDMDTNANSL